MAGGEGGEGGRGAEEGGRRLFEGHWARKPAAVTPRKLSL